MKYTSLFLAHVLLAYAKAVAQNTIDTTTEIEWRSYGNDPGGMRYVQLENINRKNVSKLKAAWTFQTGELELYKGNSLGESAAFEATPIMVKGTVYFTTPTCRVFALNAATGEKKWSYDPKIDLNAGYSEVTSRGVSYWHAPKTKVGRGTHDRLIFATIDGRLITLDATNGERVTSFGTNGTVDLKAGFAKGWSITSPPAITHNMIVVGSSLGDNQRLDYPKGTVRAYDLNTGKLMWSFDPIPKDSTDKEWGTWKNGNMQTTGGANAWAPISVDHKRELVFVPTSSPATDYYGGLRIGDNRYSNSVVALDATNGKVVWHFQVVHHDLWDYDIAAQPLLTDIIKGGDTIPVVIVGTKMGHIFVLDRRTGNSLFPIEERPVPASGIEGEVAAKTQPFPVLPAPVGLQSLSVEDAWGYTEADTKLAKARIARYVNKGIFTPPSLQGTLVTPGNVGGINWSGMCFDPKRQLLITNINRLAAIIRLLPRNKVDSAGTAEELSLRGETGKQEGTPYIMKRDYLFTWENGFKMQAKPPWGTLLAIDLKDGSKKWEVPLGYMIDTAAYPESPKWGSLSFGGAIATASGLTFIAGTVDGHLRAFDSATGEELWKTTLPAGGQATPMSYMHKGKQYVVIAAGGHGKMGTKPGDYVVAYAISE